ncbi:unnamed protein product [Auanema sp. JU1783]|nr:unnamed protein product [Auanema sp. JU1783]
MKTTRQATIPPAEPPLLILITPTGKRLERLADMTRVSQTLEHIDNIHWIVIEDGNQTVPAVENVLIRSKIPYIYLNTVSKPGFPKRGWSHRNLALEFVRQNYQNKSGVVYFADDDNTYDKRIFDHYIRKVKKIGFWAVGLVGGAYVEAPNVEKGKIKSWNVVFAPNRQFATDMAGFAVNLSLILKMNATFSEDCAKDYKKGPESCFLAQFGLKKEQLEPFGYDITPKEVLVWHTKTVRSRAKGSRYGYMVE